MTLPKLTTFAVIITTCALFAACSAEERTPAPSDMTSTQIADTVMAWWKGDYSNDAQIAALKEDGVPIWIEGMGESDAEQTLGGFLPVTSYYRTVDMPTFGDRVLYLEEFTFGDNPYRQRIYTVKENADTGGVSVKLWYFKDKTTYAGAWKDTAMIRDLMPKDMSPLPDKCDLQVKMADTGRLEMKMPKNQCKFGSSMFDYQVSLSADDFWFRDRIVNADTMRVKMTAGMFAYHKLDKLS